MKILVTGAKGMLGTDLCEILTRDHDVVEVDLEDFDITDETATREAVVGPRPDLVVHTAAWTDVDGCERDPARAFAQNGRGALHVARAAADVGATVVYISTDFVFDGSKGEPYTEFDPPHPLNAYGASKLAGEEAVRQLAPTYYIVRSAWLYGRHGKNFVHSILTAAQEKEELRVVADQFGSPTCSTDLAQAILGCVISGPLLPGTHHLVNSGVCSWAELAEEALRAAGSSTRVQPIPAAEWPSPTHRPSYSALRSRWMELHGLPPLRDWREAVRSYVKEIV